MALSHVYLYCDTVAEKLAQEESFSEDKEKKQIESVGEKFVKFLCSTAVDFKDKNMFEQVEKKWNSTQHYPVLLRKTFACLTQALFFYGEFRFMPFLPFHL